MLKPKIFKLTITVKAKDLDELDHVNNVVYLEYLQTAAIAHWNENASEEAKKAMRWVVRKLEIEYLKSAMLGDKLTVITWLENFTQITCNRFYEIRRGDELIVKASTLWVALDVLTMKPRRVPVQIQDAFFE